MSLRYRSVAAASLVLLIAVGCGGDSNPTGTVRGTIGLGESPLPVPAQIVFIDPSTGQSGVANVGEDRTFELPSPLRVGEYRVFLTPQPQAAGSDPTPVRSDLGIPGTYMDERQTPLQAKVEEGDNEFTFDVSAS